MTEAKEWIAEKEPEIRVCLFRNLATALSHPVEYAKVLIQLGYEPFVATESTSIILRKKYLGLPNVLTYLKYIKSVDGLAGCYRGLLPRLCGANVNWFVYDQVYSLSPFHESEEAEGQSEKGAIDKKRTGTCKTTCLRLSKCLLGFLPPDVQVLVKTLSWNCVSITVSTSAAYPFQVIAVRTMAQFVGRETTYNSLWGSIAEIFKTEGILGFFKGLLPRLISEVLTVVIVGTVLFVVKKHISKNHNQLASVGGSLIANAFAYQYHVVSNNMAVNDTGLAIGSYPYTHKYTSWYDCWATLRREGQLNRAANVVARVYSGPAENRNGHLVPVGFPFGPIHPRGLCQAERQR